MNRDVTTKNEGETNPQRKALFKVFAQGETYEVVREPIIGGCRV